MPVPIRVDTRADKAINGDGSSTVLQVTPNGDLRTRDDDLNTLLDAATHAEDAQHVSGDDGVMPLAVLKKDLTTAPETDGDYVALHADCSSQLYVQTQPHIHIADLNAHTGWAVIDDGADGLATSLNHVIGTGSVSFNKNDGTNHTFGGISDTITSIDLRPFHKNGGFVTCTVYFPATGDYANCDYFAVRLGTDASNYNEWRIPYEDGEGFASAKWVTLKMFMMEPTAYAGNGWDPSAVTYVAIGFNFDNEDDEVDAILVDHLYGLQGLTVTADLGVTTDVSTGAVRVRKVGASANTLWPVGSGAIDTGTPRVTIATNDSLHTRLGANGDTSAVAGNQAAQLQYIGVETNLTRQAQDSTSVKIGDTTAAASSAGGVGSLSAKLRLMTTQLDNLSNALGVDVDFICIPVNVAGGASDVVVAAPDPAYQIWVHALLSLTDAAGTLTIVDGDGSVLSGVLPIAASGGFMLAPTPLANMAWCKPAIAKSLNFTCSVGSDFDGLLIYSVRDMTDTELWKSKSMSKSRSRSRSESMSHSHSVSLSRSKSGSMSASKSMSASESLSHSHSHSKSRSASMSMSRSKSMSQSESRSHSLSHSHSRLRSMSQSRTRSKSLSESMSHSHSQSKSRSASMSMSRSLTKSLSESMSHSHSVSKSRLASMSRSKSMSRSESKSHSLSHSHSRLRSMSGSRSRSESMSHSHSMSKSRSASMHSLYSASRSRSKSLSESMSHSHSVSKSRSATMSQSRFHSLSRSRSKSKIP